MESFKDFDPGEFWWPTSHDWNSSRIRIRNAAAINISGQYNYHMTPEFLNNFDQYYIGQSYCLTSQMTMEFFNNEARAHKVHMF